MVQPTFTVAAMEGNPLIDSLQRAVDAAPDDLALRLHLAQLLVSAGRAAEAIPHVARALQQDPASTEARSLMAEALAPPASITPSSPRPRDDTAADPGEFDWKLAETDLGSGVPRMFADGAPEQSEVAAYDVERIGLTLADVGGMADVKRRLEAAFLAPLRNEKLRAMYHKSLRGGLLLYGPPGCGKTYLARALAGEMKAGFMSVSIADVLDMWVGSSEHNVHEIFEVARANAPLVLFFDEVDALGHKRSRLSSDAMRSAVNQLLTELDGVGGPNEGVFILAATNAPWDVDPALRRPGRIDRTLLVLPPDAEARATIWRLHLAERPIADIDVKRLAKLTDGYTGADIAHICETAAEHALMAAAETGDLRLISQADVEVAIAEVRPSIGPWLETARNVAVFGNASGEYDDLAKYLRKAKRL